MGLNVYLSGEIHSDWRDRIIEGAQGLDVTFSSINHVGIRIRWAHPIPKNTLEDHAPIR